jgi:hypothetical protein
MLVDPRIGAYSAEADINRQADFCDELLSYC